MVAVLVVLAVAGLAGCGGSDKGGSGADTGSAAVEQKKLKVAVMYYGDLTNAYDRAFQEAVEAVVAKIGPDRIELQEIKGVPYSEQLTQIADQALTRGADVVIDDQGGGQLLYAACKKHPDKHCITFYPTPLDGKPENVAGWFPSSWQDLYLQGVAAGKLTKSNILGYVSPFPSPLDTANVNSFLLGCQRVNPQCKVKVVAINTFFDPPKAQEATEALIRAGADVVNGLHDDPTILRVAQAKHVWGFGLYMPQAEFGPDAYVTAWLATPPASQFIEAKLREVMDDRWNGEFEPESASGSNALPLDAFGSKVPADVKTAVEEVWRDAMQSGDNRDGAGVFDGPIRDNHGKVRIAEGESLPFTTLYDKWDWYVEGVEGGK